MAKAKTTQELDRRFDEGEDIFDLAEIEEDDISRPGIQHERARTNLDASDDARKSVRSRRFQAAGVQGCGPGSASAA
jgi:hypothetical protein